MSPTIQLLLGILLLATGIYSFFGAPRIVRFLESMTPSTDPGRLLFQLFVYAENRRGNYLFRWRLFGICAMIIGGLVFAVMIARWTQKIFHTPQN